MYATVTHFNNVEGYRYHPPVTYGISNLKCLHTTLPRYEAIQPEPSGWSKQSMIDSSVPQGSKTLLDADVWPLPIFQTVINVPSAGTLGETIPLVSSMCPKNHQTDCRIYAVELKSSISVSLQAATYS